jgi:hypothetical protein
MLYYLPAFDLGTIQKNFSCKAKRNQKAMDIERYFDFYPKEQMIRLMQKACTRAPESKGWKACGVPERDVDGVIYAPFRNTAAGKYKVIRVKDTEVSKRCAYCDSAGEEVGFVLKLCGECRSLRYCSKSHQRSHWDETHKMDCPSLSK